MLPTNNRGAAFDERDKAEVVVLGCGMLGLTAALLLAAGGRRVRILEQKRRDDLGLPKSGRIDLETLRIWEQLGLDKALQGLLHPLRGMQVIGKRGKELLRIEPARPSKRAPYYGFYQPDVQRRLLQAVCAHPNIELLDGVCVDAVEPTPSGGAALFVRRLPLGGAYRRMEADYLWICSGKNPDLAEQLGLEYEPLGYAGATLNLETESRQDLSPLPYVQFFCDATLPVVRITHDNRRRRWEFALRPDDLLDAGQTERIRSLMQELSPEPCDLLSAFVHRFDSGLLQAWNRGRIFFVGDAAHDLPPHLGLGLSEGIKDAYNLAWKVHLHAEGICTEAIWESYRTEREAAVRHLVRLSLHVQRLTRSRWLRWLRPLLPLLPKSWLRRTADTSSWIQKGLVGELYPEWGRRMEEFELCDHRKQPATLDNLLDGKGFVLLGWEQCPIDVLKPEHIEFLARLHTRFVQVFPQGYHPESLPLRPKTYLWDCRGQMRRRLDTEQRRWWLLRPDGVVYDAAENQEELFTLLAKLQADFPAPDQPQTPSEREAEAEEQSGGLAKF